MRTLNPTLRCNHCGAKLHEDSVTECLDCGSDLAKVGVWSELLEWEETRKLGRSRFVLPREFWDLKPGQDSSVSGFFGEDGFRSFYSSALCYPTRALGIFLISALENGTRHNKADLPMTAQRSGIDRLHRRLDLRRNCRPSMDHRFLSSTLADDVSPERRGRRRRLPAVARLFFRIAVFVCRIRQLILRSKHWPKLRRESAGSFLRLDSG